MEETSNKTLKDQNPHIVFLSSPGMGHIIPLVELAKRLVHQHGFMSSVLTFSNFSSPTQSIFLYSLSPSISSLTIPLISLDDLSPTARIETRLCVLINRSVPHVKSALKLLCQTNNLVAFIPDFFCVETVSAAKELSLPCYLFMTSNMITLSFLLHLPNLHETFSCEFKDLQEPITLPGCVPLKGEDFPDPVMDRTDEAYNWFVQLGRRFVDSDGFLVNSFEEMEPQVVEAFNEGLQGGKKAYSVGPFVRSDMDEQEKDESGCIAWLDNQPSNSVLFISFGSGGTLTKEQNDEIAFGLEASGHRFLWVVRSPSDKETSGAFFGMGDDENPLSYLPNGFIERNKEVGLVVPLWAPQVKILSHRATGGFLTHCGWNSVLEGVIHCVPLIAWPLYAEQRMNAAMLVDGAKIALRLKWSADSVVQREDIARVVAELMEGEKRNEVMSKVKKLQEAASRTLEKGGVSYEALAEVASKWKNSNSIFPV